MSNRRVIKENLRQERKDKYSDASRRRLNKSIDRGCHTIFVGAIAKVEEQFGDLWGNDEIDPDDMDPIQIKWYNKFMDVREQIFDQGNNELCKLLDKLDEYSIIWDKYSVEFRSNHKG